MKRLITILIMMLFVCITVACSDSNKKDKSADVEYTNIKPIEAFDRTDVLAQITGKTYYLDAAASAGGNGSEDNPFNALKDVQSVLQPGDGVIISDGNYGEFVESSASDRDSWIVYIAKEGHSPVFSKVEIVFPEPANAYIILYGINIEVDWVDPASSGEPGADNPHYPSSTQNTYAKTENVVILENVNYFQIYNGVLEGTNENLTKWGIWMSTVSNILIEKNEIKTLQIPIQLWYGNTVTIRNNHIHEMVSSCFRYGKENTNVLIEKNHCHDMNWDVSEPYTPRADGENYHNSVIALYSGNVTIRNNVFHDGFTSSGIMFYTVPDYAFNNVVIENNLIYDIQTAVLRLNDAGSNIYIRNNTIIGYYREHSMGRYNYYATLNIHSLAKGHDGSKIHIYNNIFAGGVTYYEGFDKINQGNNIFWSLLNEPTNTWITDTEILNNSKVITWDSTFPTYFAKGFFVEDPVFTFAHHKTIDFRLSSTSEGLNFGDPENQPSDSLGTLDANGFVQSNGKPRDSSNHSVGAYEGVAE